MGATSSKTQFERRNTIERRSQRRSIHTIRTRLEKLYVDIKKFDGVEEDEEFHRILNQINRMRNELLKKQQDLQPEVRNICDKTLKALEDAEESLEDQLEDNQEYFKERQEELEERKVQLEASKSKTEKSKKKKDGQEVKSVKQNGERNKKNRQKLMSDSDYDEEIGDKTRRRVKKKATTENEVRKNSLLKRKSKIIEETDEDDDDEEEEEEIQNVPKTRHVHNNTRKSTNSIQIEEIEDPAQNESGKLAKTPDKRQTVELNFVKIIPTEIAEVEIHNNEEEVKEKSQADKRKSILKIGIPVIPSAMKNLISKKSKKISVQYSDEIVEHTSDELLKRVNAIIQQLDVMECQIADFVGRKYGTQYNRIRDQLNHFLVELSQYNTSEDFVLEQIKLCKNYVSSCMNFLEEKSVDDSRYDSRDDVFLPETTSSRPMSPVDAHNKLQKLSKTTAI